MATATQSHQGSQGQSQHDQSDDPRQRVMDEAVSMSSQQPEPALGIFRRLADDPSFRNRHTAREQAAILLWNFGRFEEAAKQYEKLLGELDKPEQAYFRARVIVRLSEIQVGPHSSGKMDRQQEQRLEQAEQILELNGDVYHVGKISQLKSAISVTARGDFDKAQEQAKRGRRLTRAYRQQGTGEMVLAGAGNQAYAGSSN